MARSTYVYVVVDDNGIPFVACTVKHELLTLLDSGAMDYVRRRPDRYTVWRVRDGEAMDFNRAVTRLPVDLFVQSGGKFA